MATLHDTNLSITELKTEFNPTNDDAEEEGTDTELSPVEMEKRSANCTGDFIGSPVKGSLDLNNLPSSQEIEEQLGMITGKKRERSDDSQKSNSPNKSLRASQLRVSLSNIEEMVYGDESTEGGKKKAKMERSKSLESIKKYPPLTIIRVCIEKTNKILSESTPNDDAQPSQTELIPRDYNKIKYWLLIARNVSTKIERQKEFDDFLTNIRDNYATTDQRLMDLVNETFPVVPPTSHSQ